MWPIQRDPEVSYKPLRSLSMWKVCVEAACAYVAVLGFFARLFFNFKKCFVSLSKASSVRSLLNRGNTNAGRRISSVYRQAGNNR